MAARSAGRGAGPLGRPGRRRSPGPCDLRPARHEHVGALGRPGSGARARGGCGSPGRTRGSSPATRWTRTRSRSRGRRRDGCSRSSGSSARRSSRTAGVCERVGRRGATRSGRRTLPGRPGRRGAVGALPEEVRAASGEAGRARSRSGRARARSCSRCAGRSTAGGLRGGAGRRRSRSRRRRALPPSRCSVDRPSSWRARAMVGAMIRGRRARWRRGAQVARGSGRSTRIARLGGRRTRGRGAGRVIRPRPSCGGEGGPPGR